MLRFAANLSLLYTEHAFLARYAAAAADGFTGVECLFPYDHPAADIAAQLSAHGLSQVLFNAPPGRWDAGERGLASLPGRRDEFRTGIQQALAYADVLDCPRIHVMAGLLADPDAAAQQHDHYLENLAWAATQAGQASRTLLIEPINARDMPGYLLRDQAQAHAIVDAIGSDHLKVQMDLYHCQISEGDIEQRLRTYLPTGRVAHLQIAGVPQRHEPDTGELNYAHVFNVLRDLGYDGWIGCEYRPAAGTRDGLGWRDRLRGKGV